MSSVVTKAIYERLSRDEILKRMISTYKGKPSIFTIEPIPENASLPYIVISGHVFDEPFDSQTTRGRRIRENVFCFTKADGSMLNVEKIAERVRELLHRKEKEIEVEGYQTVLVRCTGPNSIFLDGVYGMVINVEFYIDKKI